jgi:AcrR family transcriptional regulator
MLGKAAERGSETPEPQATPAARRREARREATRLEILEAAWELAREKGLAGLSLRDLGAQVGMRAPSLYQYFPSKHAIYDAMFAQGARAALETMPDDVDDVDAVADDRRDAFLAVARQFFDFAVADPTRAQLLFQRSIPGFEPSPESYQPAVEMLERVHRWFAANGITDPDAPDLWTSLLSGLVAQQLANDPGGDRWGRLLGRTIDMFLDEVQRNPNTRTTTRTTEVL